MEVDYFRVESKEQLLTLLKKLSSESDSNWENVNTRDFLEAMAAWLGSADNLYRNLNIDTSTVEPSWQLFADAIQAATVYE